MPHQPPASGNVAVLVGNPKAGSRTRVAAVHVAREVAGLEPDLVVDLAELGIRLLDRRRCGQAARRVGRCG